MHLKAPIQAIRYCKKGGGGGSETMCPFLFISFFIYPCLAAVGAPQNPLLGSQQRWPGLSWLATKYLYHGNPNLTRLLDVGACYLFDSSISFVPPLDAASPLETLCQDNYAMKFVLFDLQLVQLKSVDSVGGSFRVELQMVLHWIDSIITDSNGTSPFTDCSFLCDTTHPNLSCCDKVWVPPLKLSGCDINNIDSSTPFPYLHSSPETMSYQDCLLPNNSGICIWRRLWYLNIDATCVSGMDFHNFPFDLQDLTIDLLNPYASRTWLQLTKGFLMKNIGENINGINLSPDSKIPGWYVKDITVSSTCGTSQTWLQTFLAQDKLLSALSSKGDVMGSYESQRTPIVEALKTLTCSMMQDFNVSKDDEDLISPANWMPYEIALQKYEERVTFTLVKYRQCIEDHGKIFSWNTSIINHSTLLPIREFGYFNTSMENILRSFSLLDLEKDESPNKVWFPCAIAAVANLTNQGIRVTIRVQRYRMFYVVKLILPTLACVAFTFSAFGLQPQDLMGRLTVVVPSVIALTTLQGLIVSTDIPPVAYIAPSTYIILISYTTQVLIAFESIFINWLLTQKKPQCLQRRQERSPLSKRDAPIMHITSRGSFHRQAAHVEQQCGPMSLTRIFDLFFMCVLGLLYAISVMLCTILPWHRSEMTKIHNPPGFISIWK